MELSLLYFPKVKCRRRALPTMLRPHCLGKSGCGFGFPHMKFNAEWPPLRRTNHQVWVQIKFHRDPTEKNEQPWSVRSLLYCWESSEKPWALLLSPPVSSHFLSFLGAPSHAGFSAGLGLEPQNRIDCRASSGLWHGHWLSDSAFLIGFLCPGVRVLRHSGLPQTPAATSAVHTPSPRLHAITPEHRAPRLPVQERAS